MPESGIPHLEIVIEAAQAQRQAAIASGSIDKIIASTVAWQQASQQFKRVHGVSMQSVIRDVQRGEAANAKAQAKIASDATRAANVVARAYQEHARAAQRGAAQIAAAQAQVQSSSQGIGRLSFATQGPLPLSALIAQSKQADAELALVKGYAERAAAAAAKISLSSLSPERARAVAGEVKRLEMAFAQAAAKADVAKSKMNEALQAKKGGGGLGGMGALLGAGAALGIGREVVGTISDFQGVKASLGVVLKDTNLAQQEFVRLTELAKRTPFTVEEVTKAFIRLKGAGLDTSNEALERWGDLAASIPGKTIGNVIEAVADAVQGRDVRLKEFAGNLRVMGDQVEVSLGGARRVVQNNAKAIEKALQDLSKEKFGGAMAAQAKTLVGQFSNLKDSIDLFIMDIGEGGLASAISELVVWMTSTTSGAQGAAHAIGAVLGGAVTVVTATLQALGGIIQFVTEHSTGFTYAITGLGIALVGLNFGAITAGISAFVAAGGIGIVVTNGLTVAFAALEAVNPLGWVVIGIGSLVALIGLIKEATAATTEYFKANEDVRKTYSDARNSTLGEVGAGALKSLSPMGGFALDLADISDLEAQAAKAEEARKKLDELRQPLVSRDTLMQGGKTAVNAIFGGGVDLIGGFGEAKSRADQKKALAETEAMNTASQSLLLTKQKLEAVKGITDPFLREVEIAAIEATAQATKELAAQNQVLTDAQASQIYSSIYEQMKAQKELDALLGKKKGGESEASKQRKGLAEDLRQMVSQMKASKTLLAAAESGMTGQSLEVEAQVLELAGKYDQLGASAVRAAQDQARASLLATKANEAQLATLEATRQARQELDAELAGARGGAEDRLAVARLGLPREEADFQLAFLARLRQSQQDGIPVTQEFSNELYASMKQASEIGAQAGALDAFNGGLNAIREATAAANVELQAFRIGGSDTERAATLEYLLAVAKLQGASPEQMAAMRQAIQERQNALRALGTAQFIGEGGSRIAGEKSKLAVMQGGSTGRELEMQLAYTQRLAEYQTKYGEASLATKQAIAAQTESLFGVLAAQDAIQEKQAFAKAGIAPFVSYFEQNANVFANTASLMTSAFDGFLDKFIDGLWTGKFEFEDFAADIGKQLLKLLAKFAIVQGLNLLLPGAGAAAGGLAGLLGGGGGLMAGVFHDGGVVGSGGGSVRMISPAMTRGAPRYHSGTPYAGLKPDEMVAILQRGEEVIPRGGRKRKAGSARSKGKGAPVVTDRRRSTVNFFVADADGVGTAYAEIERRQARAARKRNL